MTITPAMESTQQTVDGCQSPITLVPNPLELERNQRKIKKKLDEHILMKSILHEHIDYRKLAKEILKKKLLNLNSITISNIIQSSS